MNQLLLALIIAMVVILIYKSVYCENVEKFWMNPSRTWKTEKLFKIPGSSNMNSTKHSDTSNFFQVPSFQSVLSPRFSNVDYGPNLRTNLPTMNHLAVPQDPLNSNITNASQGRRVHFAVSDAAEGVTAINPHNSETSSQGYTNGNYKELLGKVTSLGATNGWPTSTLSVNDSDSFLTPDGEMKQPIIYDRYMYANRNSRLRGQGDPIRGDLPIAPINGNWFIPSGAFEGPNVVLQAGALNVMGGVKNETSNELANLIYKSSGGGDTTIGGIDLTTTNIPSGPQLSMAHNVYGTTSAAGGDVQMTAFP